MQILYKLRVKHLQNIFNSFAKHTAEMYKRNTPAPLSFQVVRRTSECSALNISGMLNNPCRNSAMWWPLDVV